MVSFKWLKDQRMLKEGVRLSDKCKINREIVPGFNEIGVDVGGLPYLSHDGVFVHEMRYYRPGQFQNKEKTSSIYFFPFPFLSIQDFNLYGHLLFVFDF